MAIEYAALTEALNFTLAKDLNALPDTAMAQWCHVCQRNVETSHAHDKMVQTIGLLDKSTRSFFGLAVLFRSM